MGNKRIRKNLATTNTNMIITVNITQQYDMIREDIFQMY